MNRSGYIVILIVIILIVVSISMRPEKRDVAPVKERKYADIVESVRDSIVSIWCSKDGEDLNQGSGFYLTNDGYLLTNLHVIRDADEIRINPDPFNNDETVTASIVTTDSTYDIALLHVDTNSASALKITPGKMRLGDRVLALGFPETTGFDEIDITVSSGIVSRIKPDDFGMPLVIQTDAFITNGSSGGPLYDLDTGGVVGICTWAHHDNSNQRIPTINYALSIDAAYKVFGEYINTSD